jgi:hypothetical protein
MSPTPPGPPIKQITRAQAAEMSMGLLQAVRADVADAQAGDLIASYVQEMLEGRPLDQLTLGDVITLTQSMAKVWTFQAGLAARLADPEVTAALTKVGPDEMIRRVALRVAGGR